MSQQIDVDAARRRIETHLYSAKSRADMIIDGSRADLATLEEVEYELLRAQILLGLLVAEKQEVKPKFGLGSKVRFKKGSEPVRVTMEGEHLANLEVDANGIYTVAGFCFYPWTSSSRLLGVQFLEVNQVYFPEDTLEQAE